MENATKVLLTENELKLICVALDARGDALSERQVTEAAKNCYDLSERLRAVRRKLKGE